MKKKFIVILSVQLLITLTSIVYAFVQKGIANENLMMADAARQEAMKNAGLAKKEAVRANELASELKECKNTK